MPKKDKVNILIVDDKVNNIFALEQMLFKPGRCILSATNGNEALRTVLNKDIDLIILDVQMPEMDGFEVAQILKSNKRTREIPIIFASAEKKEHHFMMKGFEEGAIDYLYKPLNRELTEAKVSVLLELHLQKKKLLENNLALEKFALLINNSADIICIINPETLKFEEVNQAIQSLLGYTVEEVKDTSLLLYLTEDYGQRVQKLSKQVSDSLSFETKVYDKDRRIKWLHWNIVSKNGLWFANARDITEAKEVEEIKSYLATVVKQSNDAIYLHSPDGQIISWNTGAEQIYGFSEAEALGMKIWNLVPDFLLSEAQEIVESILEGSQIQALETKRVTKCGEVIDVVFAASVLTDSDSNLKSVAITERNITAQKKSEREIKQLNTDLKRNVAQLEITNKELESFSYSVSHDLRAPLRAINGYANIIREDYKDHLDDELRRLLEIIQNNAKKMGTLIDDLLAFSKLGRKELVKSTVNTAGMVKQIISETETSAKHRVNFVIGKLISAEGDYTLLNQVFINLVSNAVKYSSKNENPRVEVSSYTTDDEIIYYIKDNGTGFNMDYAHKLFGVFQRLHSDQDFEGTGVGLAIVQRVIVKHGGRVWAEGELNKGATFYFSLPKPVS
ncbi:PAS domain S-box protein [Pontibacter cellulosilyticus]|uniref:histidine kinase n=1 Tax=Pontibacter cellulosilyticus TaxID=1720253 RepID=A0A923N870_9BACT|nr:PAS domain S-box protein [Pontibacter cellulosilyticus]MBC5993539.1 PAS domain S-box protein [Pontibacter cellulosilyticus]